MCRSTDPANDRSRAVGALRIAWPASRSTLEEVFGGGFSVCLPPPDDFAIFDSMSRAGQARDRPERNALGRHSEDFSALGGRGLVIIDLWA
jgi:hypothetical protein